MEKPPPFRILSDAEFAALTHPEKLKYLRSAVEAQQLPETRIAEYMTRVIDEENKEK
jgi:hypothetical protein